MVKGMLPSDEAKCPVPGALPPRLNGSCRDDGDMIYFRHSRESWGSAPSLPTNICLFEFDCIAIGHSSLIGASRDLPESFELHCKSGDGREADLPILKKTGDKLFI